MSNITWYSNFAKVTEHSVPYADIDAKAKPPKSYDFICVAKLQPRKLMTKRRTDRSME